MAHMFSTNELEEWGQHRLLFDNVQFYVDGICSEKSTLLTQRESISQLLNLCLTPRYVNQLRLSKQSKKILQLSGILFAQSDSVCAIMLSIISLLLLRGLDGSMCTAQDMPLYSFSGLCAHSISALQTVCDISTDGVKSGAENSLISTEHGASTGSARMSVMQSRRRFKKDRTARGSSMSADTTHASMQELLAKIDPHFLHLLARGTDATVKPAPPALLLGGLLALTVVGRVLISTSELNPDDRVDLRYNSVLLETRGDDDADKDAESACYMEQLIKLFTRIAETKVSPIGGFTGTAVDLYVLWSLLSIFEASLGNSSESCTLLTSLNCHRQLVAVLCALAHTFAENVAEAFAEKEQEQEQEQKQKQEQEQEQEQSRLNLKKDLETLQALFPELLPVKARLVVQGKDVWLCAIKVLVLLSQQSAEHAAIIARENKGLVKVLVHSLGFSSSFRSAIRCYKKRRVHSGAEGISHDGALSGAMCLERFVYDSSLALVALIASIINSTLGSDLLNEMFLGETAFLNHGGEAVPQPVTSYRQHFPRRSSSTPWFVDILLRALEMETAEFVDDLQTEISEDVAFTFNKTPTAPAAAAAEESTALTKSATENEKEIPISEVILAGNLAMLLFAMLTSSEEKPIINESDLVLLLPRQSCWFLLRVLKSFLGLQVQSGVLVSDDIATIVSAIRSLEQKQVAFDESVMSVQSDGATGWLHTSIMTPSPAAKTLHPTATAVQSDSWITETRTDTVKRVDYKRTREVSLYADMADNLETSSMGLEDDENATPALNLPGRRTPPEDEWLGLTKHKQKRFGSR